ncbi:DNA helicase [Kitasatospora viridis]|uniref:DNA helicase n=1 Tax=Kitasatospora viridis TaxID=281105 RepID=A0A561UND3_9ACTN|nr:DNA helicase [Kitasatospora viridis]TWG00870.1 hypothetical protein FHX73_114750 [Kitasatospora viridis]
MTTALTYLDLTDVQRESLAALPFDGHHLVSGPPGSGKSVLATQRAVMLALSGRPTALLTRSNLLRQAIAPSVSAVGPQDEPVRVATAHAWLTQWYGEGAPRSTDGWFNWPALYERAALAAPPAETDLVVDEGQDLPPAFYRLCRILGIRVTVYADECQRLTETHSTLAEIAKSLGDCTHHDLSGNHRNTRQIAALAAHFHIGVTPPPLPERAGPPPRLHRFSRPNAATNLLVGLAEHNPRQNIGVVLSSTQAQLDLLAQLERVSPRLKPQLYTSQAVQGRYRTIDLARPGIVIINRASAKGLSFDTVVVPDAHLDAVTDPTSAGLRMAYYVLTTRARQELHIGYSGTREPSLLAPVPGELLHRH